MDLIIQNFDIKSSLKNFCKSNGGENIRPNIFFTKFKNCNNYGIIIEDTNPAYGKKIVVHWYVPNFIIKNNKIINYIEGYNTTKEKGKKYVGPCAPSVPQMHNYKFILYALDKRFQPSESQLHINSSIDYEKYLKNNNIKILSKDIKNFKVFIDKNFYKQFNVFLDKY